MRDNYNQLFTRRIVVIVLLVVVIVLFVVGIVFNIFRVSVQIREIRGNFCLELRGEESALRAVVGSTGYAL